MALLRKVFPLALILLCANCSWAENLSPTQLGHTPVIDGGRIKPADTLARSALLRFGGRTHVSDAGTRMSASVWLSKVLQGDSTVDSLRIFRIDHPELKTLVGSPDQKLFSYAELINVLPTLAQAASTLNPDSKDPYDRQLGDLTKNLLYYYELKGGLAPGGLFSQHLPELTSAQHTRVDFEFAYNQINPLFWAQVLYVLAFVSLLCAAFWPRNARTSGLIFCALALLLHIGGILSRMYIQERPPVTNLYSSAIFIGAVAVIGCGFIERGLKNNLGLLLASILGFVTLQISDKLAESGDTLEMMRAVLDSNFWLSTHVIMVTIGYSAMFVAGGIAALYVIQEFTGRTTRSDLIKTSNVVYGTVCAALLFSFIGTMLGGIWADQSWGRFWGWDPKENGALMIVLWAALILHARLDGWAKARGTLILALFGNIITAWSWFGTNLLGVGLHSYGFTNSGLLALEIFILSQLALMAAGIFFGLNKPEKTS